MIISSETHKPTKAIPGFEPPFLLLLVYFHLFLDFSLSTYFFVRRGSLFTSGSLPGCYSLNESGSSSLVFWFSSLSLFSSSFPLYQLSYSTDASLACLLAHVEAIYFLAQTLGSTLLSLLSCFITIPTTKVIIIK